MPDLTTHKSTILLASNFPSTLERATDTHQYGILHDVQRCEQHQYRKHKRTNRIDDVPLGLEEDDEGCYEHAARLHEIANHVNHRSSDVHVLVAVMMARVGHFVR